MGTLFAHTHMIHKIKFIPVQKHLLIFCQESKIKYKFYPKSLISSYKKISVYSFCHFFQMPKVFRILLELKLFETKYRLT